MKKIKKIREHKIRTRIMLLSLAVSAGLLLVLIPVMYFSFQYTTKQGINSDLNTAIDSLYDCLFYDEVKGEIKIDMKLYKKELLNGGIYFIVTDENDSLIYQSFDASVMFEWYLREKKDQYGIISSTEELMEMAVNQEGNLSLSRTVLSWGNGWTSVFKEKEIEGHYVKIEAFGNKYYDKFMKNAFRFLYIIVPVYLLLAALGSRILAKDALKPIADITRTAKNIKDGDMSQRIDTSGIYAKDEVGELATTFNGMIDEIEVSMKREKRFTSDASHELRTPVSVISACVDEALNTNDETILKENLEMIQSENKKMTKIISQLLMLSRGYEGRLQFEPETIELKDMAASVAEVAGFEASKRNIIISNNVDEGVMITADQSLYTQVLMNIVGNAVKYGKDNGHVDISSDRDDDFVWTVIKDDGIGIAKEDLEHIFERFYRADTARDRNGSGLGLSIVKWIVEMHKGEIRVQSEPGVGTEFRIGLKIKNDDKN